MNFFLSLASLHGHVFLAIFNSVRCSDYMRMSVELDENSHWLEGNFAGRDQRAAE